jgi:beta-hydroxylase
MGQYRRRFKAWNKTAYQVTRVALVVGIIALIYFI